MYTNTLDKGLLFCLFIIIHIDTMFNNILTFTQMESDWNVYSETQKTQIGGGYKQFKI